MRSKLILAVSLATSLLAGAATAPALAQSKDDVDRINKWFDKNKERQKSMDEYWNKKPGEIQKVREDWQKPGDIQKAGQIEIPKGWDAISKVKVPCQQRFRVSSDTLFEFDKATLTPYAVQTLGLLLPDFQKYKNHPVKIEGHTDALGTDGYNQGLSERRAQRVYNWLLENELFKKEALTSVGFGEKHPIAPNSNPNGTDNPKGRAQNRRVEIVVNTCVTLDGSEPPEKDPAAASTTSTPSDTKATPDASKDATGRGSTDASAKEDAAKSKDASTSTPSIREQLESNDASKDPAADGKDPDSETESKPAGSSSEKSTESAP
jgi:Outer membrane protein and related peptidoglycan-associated (lipo)proteins